MTSLTATGAIRLRRPAALLAALIVSGLGLAACAPATAVGPRTSANPNVFHARLAQENLTGVYDPRAYDSEDVQKGLAQICGNRKITDYSEQPSGGMRAFFGHCWGGTDIRMGIVTFTRMGDRLRIEIPGYIQRDSRGESRHWSIRL